MKYETATVLIAFFGIAAAAPMPEARNKLVLPPVRTLRGREVPQEHSHNQFLATVRTSLATNNPDNIQDPVFGLLGNAAAAAGQGSISDTDCLQQATADQAFTNAKAASDVTGMTAALIYRALERNTKSVGLASVACTAITPVNSEIAAISQHQDPASSGAAATNKAITLALAQQISAIGGDPQDALKAGTFAPGSTTDSTGKGNGCDTADDTVGCIYSQNLLVEDATAEEITAAVAGGSTASSNTTAAAAAASTASASTDCSVITGTTTVTAASTASATAAAAAVAATTTSAASSASTAATGTNVQTFTGTLGGAPPAVVSGTGTRPFTVNGDTFVGEGAALQRSCSVQHNACANAANSGSLSGGVSQCETQETACNAAATSAKKRATLDFGTCSDPSIVFAAGFDGRTEDSFEPSNESDFNHGSALNIGVVTSFICGQLSSACKASADTVSACATAQTAAAAANGQAAADAFNSALGVSAS